MAASTKPLQWVGYSKEEVEQLVTRLAGEKKSSSRIGMVLRDQYGIPDVNAMTGKDVTEIMREKELYPGIPEDLFNLLVRAVNIHNHMAKNKGDALSKKGLEQIESRIRDLGKYYIAKGVLPKDWRYAPEKAKLLVQK